jgi:hypothetical protein
MADSANENYNISPGRRIAQPVTDVKPPSDRCRRPHSMHRSIYPIQHCR